MPTRRPRHLITESDELRAALQVAGRRWPGASPAQLVMLLSLEGGRALEAEDAERVQRRREAAARAGRILSGTGARAQMNAMREEDWPQ